MTKRMNSKMNRVYTKVVHKRKPFLRITRVRCATESTGIDQE